MCDYVSQNGVSKMFKKKISFEQDQAKNQIVLISCMYIDICIFDQRALPRFFSLINYTN